MKRIKFTILLIVAILANHSQISAQEKNVDLFNMSLEELLNIEVTSVSKNSQLQKDVASAIYVITEEDIRRSGATRLQDLLQMMAPGLFFQFNNYNEIDFGLRANVDGFSGTVLVLIDNVPYQSAYNSAFDFANFDFDFDEIDRIEIIRGPGGTIYGANAATGVINIFTKQNQDGWHTSIKSGNRGFISPAIRYANNVTENTNIKVFAKGNFFNGFNPLDEFNGQFVEVPSTDLNPLTGAGLGTSSGSVIIQNNLGQDVYATNKVMGGFNINSDLNESLKLSAHGYFYKHKFNSYFPTPNPVEPLLLVNYDNSRIITSVRLDKTFNDNHTLFTQLSSNSETYLGSIGRRNIATLNLEVQDNYNTGIHHFNSGINLRNVDFNVGPLIDAIATNYTKERTTEYLWGAFVQDRMSFSDKVDFTLGLKAEAWTLIDNKPELSPSLRLAVKPSSNFTIWGAASRSVTTPGFIQTNLELTVIKAAPPTLPLDIVISNSAGINQSEYLTGELGFKASTNNFAIDVTGFYIKSDDLIGTSSVGRTPVQSTVDPNRLFLPITYANITEAKSYGTETILKYFASTNARFELSHSWFQNEEKGKTDPLTGEKVIRNQSGDISMPRHILRFRSYFTLKETLELSINSIYSTKSSGRNGFLYDQQRNSNFAIPDDEGVSLEGDPKGRFRMDFKIEKFFNDRNSSIFIWANDLFNSGEIQNLNAFQTGIPMQVHRIFGAGASIKF